MVGKSNIKFYAYFAAAVPNLHMVESVDNVKVNNHILMALVAQEIR